MTEQLHLEFGPAPRSIEPPPELPADAQGLLPGFARLIVGQRMRRARKTYHRKAVTVTWRGDTTAPRRKAPRTVEGMFNPPAPARGTRDWNRALLVWEPYADNRHYHGPISRPTEDAALARLEDWHPHA